ncbi:MAG: hypothetical protein E6912_16455 [Paeniclostridium sordellii]|nr:hypothetical protein [Paeniclostridium sordellii]
MIGSIKGNVIEIVKIANKICEERGLNIKNMLDTNDPGIYTIFNEAVTKFEKENEEELEECHRCKKHETNIKDIEVLCNRKKADWEGKGNLIKDGVVTGLEMALTMLR